MPIQDRAPERIQPTQPHLAEPEIAATVLIPSLKGFRIVDNASKIQLIAPEVSGVEYDLDRPLAFGRSPAFQRILDKHIGQPFTIADLTQLQQEISRLYERNNLPVVGVFAPNQDVTSGSIQLVLIEGRVGRVCFQGNHYFSKENLYSQMDTRRGRRIYESVLNEDLRWLNRSPFRDVSVELQPTDENGNTDLFLRVKEDFPVRFSAGYLDNGTQATGIERLQFSITHGNLWDRDHIANYTYNATPDFESVEVHMGSYMIPFRNRDTFTVFGYYGTMVPRYDIANFTGDGEVWQTSVRYSKLLGVRSGKTKRSESRATLGFDFKETNSNLDFGGIRVSDTAAQLAQIVFGYNYVHNYKKGYFGLDANVVWSPSGFSKHNNDQAFRQLREGATSRYTYATVNAMWVRFLNEDFQYNLRFNAQWSGERLLPIEMFGLGGDGSVRGYNTYARNSDSGWTLGNELATRYKKLGLNYVLQKLPPYHSVRKIDDEYQVYTFADLGGGWNKGAKDYFYERKYEALYGAGLGFRYNFGPWIRLDAAYGWQLKELNLEKYHDRAHVTVSFAR